MNSRIYPAASQSLPHAGTLGTIALLVSLVFPCALRAQNIQHESTDKVSETRNAYTNPIEPAVDATGKPVIVISAPVLAPAPRVSISGAKARAAISAAEALRISERDPLGATALDTTQSILQGNDAADEQGAPIQAAGSSLATTYVRPQTINIGDNQSQTSTIMPGQIDTDALSAFDRAVPVSVITSNTNPVPARFTTGSMFELAAGSGSLGFAAFGLILRWRKPSRASA